MNGEASFKKNAMFSLTVLFLIPLCILIVEIIFGSLTLWKVVLGIAISAVIVIVAFFIVMWFLSKEHSHTSSVLKSMQNLENVVRDGNRLESILISNEELKDIETEAEKIRVITPCLRNDSDKGLFYATVRDNLGRGKQYQYIIPNSDHIKAEWKKLVKDLKGDLKQDVEPVLMEMRCFSDFPITTEFVLYDIPKKLMGFAEVVINPTSHQTTNYPLSQNQTFEMNELFDRLFEQ